TAVRNASSLAQNRPACLRFYLNLFARLPNSRFSAQKVLFCGSVNVADIRSKGSKVVEIYTPSPSMLISQATASDLLLTDRLLPPPAVTCDPPPFSVLIWRRRSRWRFCGNRESNLRVVKRRAAFVETHSEQAGGK